MKTRPFVSTEYTNVTDGRTDTAQRYRPRLCIALRGKKTTSRGDRSVWSVAYSFVELSSVKYKAVVCSIDDAALAGDRPSSVDVVSRHHAHRYTRPLTLAYSFRYLHAHTHTSSLSASSSSSSSSSSTSSSFSFQSSSYRHYRRRRRIIVVLIIVVVRPHHRLRRIIVVDVDVVVQTAVCCAHQRERLRTRSAVRVHNYYH